MKGLLALADVACRCGVLWLALAAAVAFAGEEHGLKGEYYAGVDFETLKLERLDPQLDFNWSREGPAKDVPRETLSVRWTGSLVPRFSELYTFHTLSDDGVCVWINDRLLIDNWTDHGAAEDTGSIRMEAGKPYNIRLEYYQRGGEAVLKLLWSSPSQRKQVIPVECLSPVQVPRPELPPMRQPALEVPATLPELARRGNWDASLAAFESLGVPRAWLILAPQSDRNNQRFLPERTDNWRNILQIPAYLPTLWTRPEEEEPGEGYVDVGRILDWDKAGMTFARTEVSWGAEGRARVWFSCRQRGELFLDNVRLLAMEEPVRTPRCVTVDLRRGTHVFKVKLASQGGAWGFSFRIERDAPDYRAALFAKLLEWHPRVLEETRGAGIMLEVARCRDEAGLKDVARDAFLEAVEQFPYDEEVRSEASEAVRRLMGAAAQGAVPGQAWPETVERVERLLALGGSAAADAELRTFVARFPRSPQSIEALVRRGRLRQAWGLGEESRAFFRRAMRESPRHPEVLRFALPALDLASRQSPVAYAVETTPDLPPLIEAARRQLHSGAPGDVTRAVRNLDDAWRMGGTLFVPAPARGAPMRHVGTTLAMRRLAEELDALPLATYAQDMEAHAALVPNPESAEVPGLVERARRFPFTSVSIEALNRAANRALDEGRWSESVTLLERLSSDALVLKKDEMWIAAEAKRIRALIEAGEWSAASDGLHLLTGRMKDQTVTVCGQELGIDSFARQQERRIREGLRNEPLQSASRPLLATLSGDVSRACAPAQPLPAVLRVAWRAPLPLSPAHLRARERLGVDAPRMSTPVVAENRILIANLESLSAYDLVTGRLLWQVNHTSSELEWPEAFAGFPVVSPSYADGLVYLRVLEAGRSELRAYAVRDGLLRWQSGASSELAGLVWLGDPAVAGQAVYGVYMERIVNGPTRHGVACLDARSGALKWKRQVLSGTAGWRVGNDVWLPVLHQGPPAVGGGVVYAATGLNSLVALDAFTGQPLWLTAYPAPESGAVNRDGRFRPCLQHLLRRGPASLLVRNGTVLLAPRDAPGLFAFDARTGEPVWSQDLSDTLQLLAVSRGGVCGVGHGVSFFDLDGGATIACHELPGTLLGFPALAGMRVYAATRDQLLGLDVNASERPPSLTWKELGLNPLHSCFVVGEQILAVGDAEMALLSSKELTEARTPFDLARAEAARGNWAEAGRRFAVAMNGQREYFLDALMGWATAQLRIGFERRALAELDYWLSKRPERLVSQNGLWEVHREALRDGLRVRLGQGAPASLRTMPRGLPSVLAYAGHIPLEDPRLILPEDGLGSLAWATERYYLSGVELVPQPRLRWRVYHGLGDDPHFRVGPTALVAWNARELRVFDRLTGEPLWTVSLENLRNPDPGKLLLGRFTAAALDRDVVVVATREVMFCLELKSGRERWAQVAKDRHTHHLGLLGGRVVEVGGDQQWYYRGLDLTSGQESVHRDLGAGSKGTPCAASRDGRYLALRQDDEHAGCLDLATGGWLWSARVRKFKRETARFEWRDAVLCLHGEVPAGEKPGRRTLELRASDGAVVRAYDADLWPVRPDQDCLRFAARANDQFEVLRVHPLGTEEAEPQTVWHYEFSRELSPGGQLRGVFPGERAERIHLLFTRTAAQPHFVLRTFDWARGQFVHEEILPGVPFSEEGRRPYEGWAGAFEDRLVYSATDGLYVYSGAGNTRREAGMALDQLAPSATIVERENLRRARAGVEPPGLHVLRAPDTFRLWGDPSAWEQADAVRLDTQAAFIPLKEGAEWRGPGDLSVKARVLWNTEGLLISVTTTDDRHVPAEEGAPLTTGDCLRVVVDATPDWRSGSAPEACWSGTVAWLGGRTVCTSDTVSSAERGSLPEGGAVLAPDGHGVRYELLIPWALLRRSAAQRPGSARQVRLGLAVYDNDGQGVRGAMEWGAGARLDRLFSPWLGELFLLDLSREWVNRYREVVAQLPDAPEALVFLRRLALSHRGPLAAATRVTELETFVKAHPDSPNVVAVLKLLYSAYWELESTAPRPRLAALVKAAHCPAELVRQIEAWPRPAGPGKGLEGEYFDNQDFTDLALVRVDPILDFNWSDRGPAPNMPPTTFSVRWTGQVAPKYSQDYTFYTRSDDGVRLWVDDRLLIDNWTDHPLTEDQGQIHLNAGTLYDVKLEYFQGYGDAGLSLLWSSASQQKELIPAASLFPSGLSFLEAPPWKPDPAVMREAYRKTALLLSDTPDGALLFERLLETFAPDAIKERVQECENYLKARPGTLHAGLILQKLLELYPGIGRDPVASCKALMQSHRLQQDLQRDFYRQYVPAWTDWHAIGPFPSAGLDEGGLDRVLPPERGVDLKWKATGVAELQLAWVQTDRKKTDGSGLVDLRKLLIERLPKGKEKEIENNSYFAYAYRRIHVKQQRRALIFYGAEENISIWLNGKPVLRQVRPGPEKDAEALDVTLKEGENEILLKVGASGEKWGFFFRIADPNGCPLPELPAE